jgi:hypothetical protein
MGSTNADQVLRVPYASPILKSPSKLSRSPFVLVAAWNATVAALLQEVPKGNPEEQGGSSQQFSASPNRATTSEFGRAIDG